MGETEPWVEIRKPKFLTHLCLQHAVWPQVSHPTSLCFKCLNREAKTIIWILEDIFVAKPGVEKLQAPGPNLVYHLFLRIKFCWNTVTSICLHIDYGCFSASAAELNSCNRHWFSKPKIFANWPFAEKVCWPWSKQIKGLWYLLPQKLGPRSFCSFNIYWASTRCKALL